MNELENRIVKLISDKRAIEADDILSKEVKNQLITAINNELKEYDKQIKRNSQNERMENAHRIADEAKKARESYEVGKNINEIFEKKLSKLRELNDPVVNEGLAFREEMITNHNDDMSVAQEYQNYVDAQYRKYFREDALRLEKETRDIQNEYEVANGLNDSKPENQPIVQEIPENDNEAKDFMSGIIEEKDTAANDKETQLNDDSKDIANAETVAGIIAGKSKERPVYADPNNDLNASNIQANSGEVDATTELAGEETVEQNNNNSQEKSEGRKLVSRIKEGTQILKEKLTANNNQAIKAIAIVVAAGAAVLTAGAALGVSPALLATAGVAGYGANEFNKGRKL